MIRRIRRASARRLALAGGLAVAGAVILAAAASALTPAASPPPPASAAQVVRLAQTARLEQGMSARLEVRNDLLAGLDVGEEQALPPILTGGGGRFWMSGRDVRFELQSERGDVQLLAGSDGIRLLDAVQGTESLLPLAVGSLPGGAGGHAVVPDGWSAGDPVSAVVGGRPAYRIVVRPDDRSSLLAGVELAVDADTGLLLSAGVLADGRRDPVLLAELHDVRLGDVGRGVFRIDSRTADVVPPAEMLGGIASPGGARAVAGSGLSTVWRWRGAPAGEALWDALPAVSVGGAAARELVTPLGTVLRVYRDGEVEVFAGLVPPAAVRAAAEAS
jgi:hypothetical protein